MAKILIIDDEKNICKTLSEFLIAEGHQTSTSFTADGMLKLIAEESFDIVICDIILPKIRGTEFINKLHQKFPDIKAILITGQPSVSTIIDGIRSQIFDYLPKPITKSILLKTINKAIQAKASEDLTKKLKKENELFQQTLEEEVDKKSEALSQLLKSINTFQKQEEISIANKIHDTVGQDLISLKLYLQSTFTKFELPAKKAQEIIDDINGLIEETRKFTRLLNPISMQHMGLKNAITEKSKQIAAQKNINIKLEISNLEQICQRTWCEEIYNIINSTIMLLANYTGSTEIYIETQNKEDTLSIDFSYNGALHLEKENFFDPAKGHSLELLLLEEKINMSHGDINPSNKNLQIILPLDKQNSSLQKDPA